MNPNPRSFGGRGGGRNATSGRQQMPTVPISLAKQEKSHEERLYSRFKDLDPEAVRVTRYRSGTLLEEIFLKKPKFGPERWYSSIEAEGFLNLHLAETALERARLRAPVRLGIQVPDDRTYQLLTDNQKRLLFMTQKEFNSFRASQGTQGQKPFPEPVETGTGAEPTSSVSA
jgi:hypothetical protein